MPTDPEILSLLRTPNKDGRLLLAPSGVAGAFDRWAVDVPFVFAHAGRFWMTFVGWDGDGYQTGLASSDDLAVWRREGLILGRGADASPTRHNAALTCILRDNAVFGPGTLRTVGGRFLGTYHAYPQPGYEAGPAVIGLCWSDDLRTWQVDPPVLTADPACAWEAGGLYKSWLLEHDGTYYLFYNAKTHAADWPWQEQTGLATSTDLKTWTRHPANPILRNGSGGDFDAQFASDPCVLRHDGTWVMFYFGLAADGHAREGVAFSDDLLTWRKADAILVDAGPPGSIDSQFAHKAGIIAAHGRLHHFYCAVAPAEFGPQRSMRGIACARG